MNVAVLLLCLVGFSEGLFFGVFEDSTVSFEQDELAVQERAAFSWLADQLFHPRDSESRPTKTTFCSGFFCPWSTDLSQPVHVDAFVEAWYRNQARNWTVDQVANWVDLNHKHPHIRHILLRNQVSGRKLVGLLVTESHSLDHEVPIRLEDLLWLKERITALILLGPPTPITSDLLLTHSALCIFSVLLGFMWSVWRQLIVPHQVKQRVLNDIVYGHQLVDRLRNRLVSTQNSLPQPVTPKKSVSTFIPTDATPNLCTLYRCVAGELQLMDIVINLIDYTMDHMESEVIRYPRSRMSSFVAQYLQQLISFVDTLWLRVDTISTRALCIRELDSLTHATTPVSVETQTPAIIRTSVLPTAGCVHSMVNGCESQLAPTPQSDRKVPEVASTTSVRATCGGFPPQDTTPIITATTESVSVTEESSQTSQSDRDENWESDDCSSGSPKENRPCEQSMEVRTQHKMSMSKIPQPSRGISSQALTPLFSVMNSSGTTTRWDCEHAQLVTPSSHIPVSSHKSATMSPGRKPLHSRILAPRDWSNLTSSLPVPEAVTEWLSPLNHSD